MIELANDMVGNTQVEGEVSIPPTARIEEEIPIPPSTLIKEEVGFCSPNRSCYDTCHRRASLSLEVEKSRYKRQTLTALGLNMISMLSLRYQFWA